MKITYQKLYAYGTSPLEYYAKMLADPLPLGGRERPTWREVGGDHIGINGDIATGDDLKLLRKNIHPRLARKLTLRTKPAKPSRGKKASGRRLGYDFTVTPDKVISVLALIGGDRRVLEAFCRVCSRNLEGFAEFAAARVRRGKKTEIRISGHLLSLPIDEFWSRHNKPLVHRHHFCANVSYDPVEGCLKALEPAAILGVMRLLEARLNADMVYELRCLGYAVESKAKRGCLVAGMPQGVIDAMSDRGPSREDRAAKTPAILKSERVRSRPPKMRQSLPELVEQWKRDLGPDRTTTICQLVEQAKACPPAISDDKALEAAVLETLTSRLTHLSNIRGLFSLHELELQTLQELNGQCPSAMVTKMVRQTVEKGLASKGDDGLFSAFNGRSELEALAKLIGQNHDLSRLAGALQTWTVCFPGTNGTTSVGNDIIVEDANKLTLTKLKKRIETAAAQGCRVVFQIPRTAIKGKEPTCVLAALARMVWTDHPAPIKTAIEQDVRQPPPVELPPSPEPAHPGPAVSQTAPPMEAVSGKSSASPAAPQPEGGQNTGTNRGAGPQRQEIKKSAPSTSHSTLLNGKSEHRPDDLAPTPGPP